MSKNETYKCDLCKDVIVGYDINKNNCYINSTNGLNKSINIDICNKCLAKLRELKIKKLIESIKEKEEEYSPTV